MSVEQSSDKVCCAKGKMNGFAALDTPPLFCSVSDMPVKPTYGLAAASPTQGSVSSLLRLFLTHNYYYTRGYNMNQSLLIMRAMLKAFKEISARMESMI